MAAWWTAVCCCDVQADPCSLCGTFPNCSATPFMVHYAMSGFTIAVDGCEMNVPPISVDVQRLSLACGAYEGVSVQGPCADCGVSQGAADALVSIECSTGGLFSCDPNHWVASILVSAIIGTDGVVGTCPGPLQTICSENRIVMCKINDQAFCNPYGTYGFSEFIEGPQGACMSLSSTPSLVVSEV